MRPLGSRTDQGHLAHEDVEQLGQLVEAGLAQHATDLGDARVVLGGPDGARARLGIAVHAAELDDGERLAAQARALLQVEDRASVLEDDREAHQDPHGDQEHDQDRAGRNVEQAREDEPEPVARTPKQQVQRVGEVGVDAAFGGAQDGGLAADRVAHGDETGDRGADTRVAHGAADDDALLEAHRRLGLVRVTGPAADGPAEETLGSLRVAVRDDDIRDEETRDDLEATDGLRGPPLRAREQRDAGRAMANPPRLPGAGQRVGEPRHERHQRPRTRVQEVAGQHHVHQHDEHDRGRGHAGRDGAASTGPERDHAHGEQDRDVRRHEGRQAQEREHAGLGDEQGVQRQRRRDREQVHHDRRNEDGLRLGRRQRPTRALRPRQRGRTRRRAKLARGDGRGGGRGRRHGVGVSPSPGGRR